MSTTPTDAQFAAMDAVALVHSLFLADEAGALDDRQEAAYAAAFHAVTDTDEFTSEDVTPAYANRFKAAFLAELAKTSPETAALVAPMTVAERAAATLGVVDFTPAPVLEEDREADPIDLEDTAGDRFVW